MPGRLTLQHQMVAAFERNEARPWNTGCEASSLLEGLNGIVPAMKDQGRHADPRKQLAHVDVVGGVTEPNGILRRCGEPLQIIKPPHLLS